jgi:hypothetical protein
MRARRSCALRGARAAASSSPRCAAKGRPMPSSAKASSLHVGEGVARVAREGPVDEGQALLGPDPDAARVAHRGEHVRVVGREGEGAAQGLQAAVAVVGDVREEEPARHRRGGAGGLFGEVGGAGVGEVVGAREVNPAGVGLRGSGRWGWGPSRRYAAPRARPAGSAARAAERSPARASPAPRRGRRWARGRCEAPPRGWSPGGRTRGPARRCRA